AIGRHFDLERLARPMVRPATGIVAWLYYLRPTQAFAQQAKQRFQRQGIWGVFLGRLIPIVRSFISYPAGAARMPFLPFLIATTAGSFLWIAFWTLLGAGLGRSYQQAEARWGTVSWLILAGLIAAIGVVWLCNHRRARSAETLRESSHHDGEHGARHHITSHTPPSPRHIAKRGTL
ncbi:MAG TPA: DedA family protein, partial [Ktedonobacterales bacterium]